MSHSGLSHDEPWQVSNVRDRFVAHPWAEVRFPPFDPEMARGDCMDDLKGEAIPHEVPRSD